VPAVAACNISSAHTGGTGWPFWQAWVQPQPRKRCLLCDVQRELHMSGRTVAAGIFVIIYQGSKLHLLYKPILGGKLVSQQT
jgi:hypothetical protein